MIVAYLQTFTWNNRLKSFSIVAETETRYSASNTLVRDISIKPKGLVIYRRKHLNYTPYSF